AAHRDEIPYYDQLPTFDPPVHQRTEAKIGLQRLLERTSNIWIDEDKHGPEGNRRYTYLPTFILRGLTRLHIGFE
ncbi:MAG TPA: hypothetical protein VN306_07940, partial [Mycobacterium sp.]|nr:hypothetical protein [Mycobacterium sp.]